MLLALGRNSDVHDAGWCQVAEPDLGARASLLELDDCALQGAMTSVAAPSASTLAAASLGAGIVLLLQQTPCCSGARGSGAASPAKRANAGLVVERLSLGDATGRQFVLDGFRGIQAAEGRSWEDIPDEEMETIAADLEATLSPSGSRQGGVLVCRVAAGGPVCGYLWFLDAIETPFGAGSYPPESEPYVWVHTVFTAPDMRRQGVGKLLYRQLDVEARQAGGSRSQPFKR